MSKRERLPVAPYYDLQLGVFPLKEEPWLAIGNHRILKYLMIAFGLACGGFASAGYALMALWFPLRKKSRHEANKVAALAFLVGTLMGWGQMMRGAHFLAHNLWTAWVVWVVSVAIALCFYPSRSPAEHRSA